MNNTIKTDVAPKQILDLDEICLDDEKSIFEAIEGPDEIKSPVAIEKPKEKIKPLKTPLLKNLAREEAIFNSPLTPMPTYVAMDTPILKNELKRFGILKRVFRLKFLFFISFNSIYRHQSITKETSCS
jgi:hypothetical protein